MSIALVPQDIYLGLWESQERCNPSLKILLAGRTQDITQLTREIALQPDMEIVGEYIDPVEVLLTAKSREVDAVVISVKDSGDSGLVSHLLSEMPNLTVLMASSTDKLAYIVQLCPQRREHLDTSDFNLVRALRSAVENPCVQFDQTS